ncbi:hypothetical protein G4G27_06850 [Sphingomonas sp. So64.6b]|uniref:DUF6544 family protein n=1 Tax=Sphingomonas sp. So64.6b TaxID=2997354 RepID=UPI0016020909|nr:DUF6544 family protein [Sphingomonas sp. So64.6b]QNA83738.1 hypothetical protein G4G27_06850 [Sphingomonas sp. So64.6b]
MADSSSSPPNDLPVAVRDLAIRLGAEPQGRGAIVRLTQTGRMKRALGSDSWMSFSARQTIASGTCGFAWRARFGPIGMISVCDALDDGVARLDVAALGFIPIARTPRTSALVRGELMRYLAELAWSPDAILSNPSLRWRIDGPDRLVVGAGIGASAVEVVLTLDIEGRIVEAFAPDRPRSPTEPILPTPWRGYFTDYRFHRGRWLPFAGEVGWEIAGREEIYWQGRILDWRIGQP